MKVLAADIGGTNTRLICAEVHAEGWQVIAEKNYISADFSDFSVVLTLFIQEHIITGSIDAACFAVAGPVKSGVVKVTNLPWLISEDEIAESLRIPVVKLINDFIAVVYGLSELTADDTLILQQPDDKNNSPEHKHISHPAAVVIGAGTGLGVAQHIFLNGHYHALPTESGHAGFAPANEQQSELLQWLQKTQSHVSLETVLSGRGLVNIYNFIREQGQLRESNAVINAMELHDPAQVISDYALSESDELCQKTLECFIDIYGAAAGNISLHFYPVDEVYIAGGIAPKIKNKLLEKRFIDAFNHKGLMSANLEQITVKLVLQEKIGLYGALAYALTL